MYGNGSTGVGVTLPATGLAFGPNVMLAAAALMIVGGLVMRFAKQHKQHPA